ncbi:8714_t:CDS:2 [Diversispora eburnea]|uniref:8714_t:CDS:1 n=1 Tax=Diversispora eburnea TaxID=1213867 RepID=A0A9N9A0F8_9GLOM|nr:8714_t:CDS:2 [Diversispora eburnea]
MSFSNNKKDLIRIEEDIKIQKLDYNTFEDIKLIATGGFGAVNRAYSKVFKKHVALKCLFDGNSDNFYKVFMNELKNIKAVNRHENIIKFYGVSIDQEEKKCYLVLQYAKDDNLRTYLRNNFENLNWKTKINLAQDIANGLCYIHKANILHRDLHSKNVLVHKGKLLITDFGLSKILDTNSNSFKGGMYAYLDPEYLRNSITYKRDKASDIYSLGMLFWELSSGKPPFGNLSSLQISEMVKSGKREASINGTPEDYIKIYSDAWLDDPKQRPIIEDICDSLENIQFENIYYSSTEICQSNKPMEPYSSDFISLGLKQELQKHKQQSVKDQQELQELKRQTVKDQQELQELKQHQQELQEQTVKDQQKLQELKEQNVKDQHEFQELKQQTVKDQQELQEQTVKDQQELQELKEQSVKDQHEFQELKQQTVKDQRELLELKQQIIELREENAKYQVENVQCEDLKKDIEQLQETLSKYVTDLQNEASSINYDNVNKLLQKYDSLTVIDSSNPDKILIKAALQRHLLEEIFHYSKEYFKTIQEMNHTNSLVSNLTKKTDQLSNLMIRFLTEHNDDNRFTLVSKIKLRKLIYDVLGRHGFNNDHPFILDVSQPIPLYCFFKSGDKIDETFMNVVGSSEEPYREVVDVCSFPMIGKDLSDPSKRMILTKAKVCSRINSVWFDFLTEVSG